MNSAVSRMSHSLDLSDCFLSRLWCECLGQEYQIGGCVWGECVKTRSLLWGVCCEQVWSRRVWGVGSLSAERRWSGEHSGHVDATREAVAITTGAGAQRHVFIYGTLTAYSVPGPLSCLVYVSLSGRGRHPPGGADSLSAREGGREQHTG